MPLELTVESKAVLLICALAATASSACDDRPLRIPAVDAALDAPGNDGPGNGAFADATGTRDGTPGGGDRADASALGDGGCAGPTGDSRLGHDCTPPNSCAPGDICVFLAGGSLGYCTFLCRSDSECEQAYSLPIGLPRCSVRFGQCRILCDPNVRCNGGCPAAFKCFQDECVPE
jgi:hypothetical protein